MQNLIINSRDRKGTISNGFYELDNVIERFRRVRVNWLSLYNTFYNITGANNTISITNSSDIIAIPVGHYTTERLISTLDILFKGFDSTMSVTYDTVSNRAYWEIPQLPIDIEKSTAKHLLGLPNLLGTLDTTFFTIINLSHPAAVSFYSPQLQGSTARTNRKQLHYDSFLTVPIFASFNQLNFYEPNSPLFFECSKNVLQSLEIHLRSTGGEKLYNLTDYLLSLTFYE